MTYYINLYKALEIHENYEQLIASSAIRSTLIS
jgi:hypothetical protein